MGVPSTRWLTIPSVPSAGGTSSGAALSDITAAVATNSIVSTGNIPQSWSFDTNTDSTRMFIATETTPSTGGTSTTGVPNQVLLTCWTAPASTMAPLSVFTRGNHVVSVSPTTRQVFFTPGTASLPPISFTSDTVVGIYYGSKGVTVTRNGTEYQAFGQNQFFGPVGTAPTLGNANGLPSVTDITNFTSGLYFPDNQTVGIQTNLRDNAQFVGGGAGGTVNNYLQLTNALATAVGYAINARKSRTTATIVTGDNLLTIGSAGYDGTEFATTTLVTHTTEGTISRWRVPGVITWQTATAVGTLTEVFRVNSSQNFLIGTTTESSTLTVNGGLSLAYTSISAAFTVVTNTWAVYASAPIAVTVTLPVVANAKGKSVLVKKTDAGANAVSIAKAGGSGDTIEGVATVTLASQYASRLLHNDGLNTWYVVSTI